MEETHVHVIPIDPTLTVDEAWKELCIFGKRVTTTGACRALGGAVVTDNKGATVEYPAVGPLVVQLACRWVVGLRERVVSDNQQKLDVGKASV